MAEIDVLLVTALEMEFDAARDAASQNTADSCGVVSWVAQEEGTSTPYLRGVYRTVGGKTLNIILARPTRMGGVATLTIASALADRVRPRCLAMCGVCAGNPGELALGDVVIAEMAYAYDEGKLKLEGFEGDHRQYPMQDTWVRMAQDLRPEGLPSFRRATPEDRKNWLLQRLYAGDNPQKHPARSRYFPSGEWKDSIKKYVEDGLMQRNGSQLELTPSGRAIVEEVLLLEIETPSQLPFQIKVGPIASGNVVVKDGLTWDKLAKWGVRSVLGLEMEAAAIASLAHRLAIPNWIVAKGVMDYADPRKEDRHKPFAARAAAEVLYALLASAMVSDPESPRISSPQPKSLLRSTVQPKSGEFRVGVAKSREVLFDSYRPEYEPYYLVREIDRDVSEALQQTGLWLYGPSGVGKTCSITRMLSQKHNGSYVCISLASCLDGKLRTILEHIRIELSQYGNLNISNGKRLNDSQLISEIKSVISRLGSVFSCIYLDEIPIDNAALFRQFVQALGAIATPPRISLIVTSIYSPREYIPSSQQSFLQSVRLLESKRWEPDELNRLSDLIVKEIGLPIERSMTDRIVNAALGSPRFVKKALGTLLAHEGNPAWSLERILEETKRDLG